MLYTLVLSVLGYYAKWRFSSVNHQNFYSFFCVVSESPNSTGVICDKTPEPNISCLGPLSKDDLPEYYIPMPCAANSDQKTAEDNFLIYRVSL